MQVAAALHIVPHEPQLFMSLGAVSQPLAALPSQSSHVW
jgi:hypothetical protein